MLKGMFADELTARELGVLSEYAGMKYDSDKDYWKIKKDGSVEWDGSYKVTDERTGEVKDFTNSSDGMAYILFGNTSAESKQKALAYMNSLGKWNSEKKGWYDSNGNPISFNLDKKDFMFKAGTQQSNATVKKESLLDSINNWFKGLFKGNDKPKTETVVKKDKVIDIPKNGILAQNSNEEIKYNCPQTSTYDAFILAGYKSKLDKEKIIKQIASGNKYVYILTRNSNYVEI